MHIDTDHRFRRTSIPLSGHAGIHSSCGMGRSGTDLSGSGRRVSLFYYVLNRPDAILISTALCGGRYLAFHIGIEIDIESSFILAGHRGVGIDTLK